MRVAYDEDSFQGHSDIRSLVEECEAKIDFAVTSPTARVEVSYVEEPNPYTQGMRVHVQMTIKEGDSRSSDPILFTADQLQDSGKVFRRLHEAWGEFVHKGTIRERGLEYLRTRPGAPERESIHVSKRYHACEAPTGSPVWCFDIPTRKIERGECKEVHLLCEIAGASRFHYLRVPSAFMEEKREKLSVEDKEGNAYFRLHLSDRDEDRFVDLLGSLRSTVCAAGVDFSKWLVP